MSSTVCPSSMASERKPPDHMSHTTFGNISICGRRDQAASGRSPSGPRSFCPRRRRPHPPAPAAGVAHRSDDVTDVSSCPAVYRPSAAEAQADGDRWRQRRAHPERRVARIIELPNAEPRLPPERFLVACFYHGVSSLLRYLRPRGLIHSSTPRRSDGSSQNGRAFGRPPPSRPGPDPHGESS